ncbi:DUF3060 domain-containing protein [Agrococcus sp. SGAir0287]|uniref:DUF3060 domain-containing protein n=1 Tax=Agrococcus sp. SGAir0287 TaxID=2070347 RepID=UPI0010CD0F9F|nr:DUF3060 domain-containing protein [Agrococcus sp. SGAir0287]QCR18294.1 hypothetical protein C1N71_01560 [Agrococcus sp. SGAir0287]
MTTHDPIAQPRWFALVALTIVAVGSLSGCGLAFSDPDATDPAPSSQDGTGSSPEADAAESDPADGEPAASDPAETETGAPGASSPDRDALIARASQTIPCSPGLDVTTDGGIVRVEGTCDDLTVSADAAIVIADDVAVLTITGSGTVVSTLALGELRITGDVNDVRWTGATPAVTDDGTANTMGEQQ